MAPEETDLVAAKAKMQTAVEETVVVIALGEAAVAPSEREAVEVATSTRTTKAILLEA